MSAQIYITVKILGEKKEKKKSYLMWVFPTTSITAGVDLGPVREDPDL